jgi:hypothetical protein
MNYDLDRIFAFLGEALATCRAASLNGNRGQLARASEQLAALADLWRHVDAGGLVH